MIEVVVLGDVNVDIIARLESYPPLGGDVQPLTTALLLGGTSLNTAIVLRRLGVETALVGRVGRDVLGDFAVAEMERNGLSARWIQRDDEVLTGLAYIAITPDGQRTMLGGAGANRNLDASALPLDVIAHAKWLHISSYNLLGETPCHATFKTLDVAKANGVTTSLDIGNAPQRLAPEALMQVAREIDVLMPSGALIPSPSPILGKGSVVIRKLGAHGCEIVNGGEVIHVPAFAVQVVDTTGAGDAFNGGFIAGRVRGLDVRASALLGNACGAAAVMVNGAGGVFPSRKVVVELLREKCPSGWEAEAAQIHATIALMREQTHDQPT